MLLLYAMKLFYVRLALITGITFFIDNSEMVRRRRTKVPTLGAKRQLVLDYDLWATTQRLQEVLECTFI